MANINDIPELLPEYRNAVGADTMAGAQAREGTTNPFQTAAERPGVSNPGGSTFAQPGPGVARNAPGIGADKASWYTKAWNQTRKWAGDPAVAEVTNPTTWYGKAGNLALKVIDPLARAYGGYKAFTNLQDIFAPDKTLNQRGQNLANVITGTGEMLGGSKVAVPAEIGEDIIGRGVSAADRFLRPQLYMGEGGRFAQSPWATTTPGQEEHPVFDVTKMKPDQAARFAAAQAQAAKGITTQTDVDKATAALAPQTTPAGALPEGEQGAGSIRYDAYGNPVGRYALLNGKVVEAGTPGSTTAEGAPAEGMVTAPFPNAQKMSYGDFMQAAAQYGAQRGLASRLAMSRLNALRSEAYAMRAFGPKGYQFGKTTDVMGQEHPIVLNKTTGEATPLDVNRPSPNAAAAAIKAQPADKQPAMVQQYLANLDPTSRETFLKLLGNK